MIFPEADAVDYSKIEDIVKKQINLATDKQTDLLAQSDLVNAVKVLKTALRNDRLAPSEDELSRVITRTNELSGQIEDLKVTSIEHGDKFQQFFALYLTSANLMVDARRHVWSRYAGMGDPKAEGEKKILMADIDEAVEKTTELAAKLVLRQYQADLDYLRTHSGDSDYPQPFRCDVRVSSTETRCAQEKMASDFDEGGYCIRWEEVHTYAVTFVGANGYATPTSDCSHGRGLLWTALSAFKGCEESGSWSSCYQQYHSQRTADFTEPAGKRYGVGNGDEAGNSIGRIRRHYYKPFDITGPFQTKWLVLKACVNSPQACTKQAWTNWMVGDTKVDDRCSYSGTLGRDHPLCPPYETIVRPRVTALEAELSGGGARKEEEFTLSTYGSRNVGPDRVRVQLVAIGSFDNEVYVSFGRGKVPLSVGGFAQIPGPYSACKLWLTSLFGREASFTVTCGGGDGEMGFF